MLPEKPVLVTAMFAIFAVYNVLDDLYLKI